MRAAGIRRRAGSHADIRARHFALALGAAALAACGGTAREAQAPGGAAGAGAACAAFDPAMDLYFSLTTPASFGSSTDLFYLVDLDEDLGVLRGTRAALRAQGDADARALATKLDGLAEAMDRTRRDVVNALAAVEKTYEAAETALDDAAACQNVDLRDPGRGPDGAPAPEKARRANQAKLASRACESAVRLWGAVQNVELTSDVSSSAVAAQIGELRLDGERRAVREKLAAALRAHVQALRKLRSIGAPPAGATAEASGVGALRDEAAGALRAFGRSCFERMQSSARVVGGHAEPRDVTVVVRPRWPESLAMLPHDESFGSGFVVRWRAPDGRVETRIVTNNHVMDGAFEADIVPGDAGAARAGGAGARATATLVQANPHDDIAVLRVDPGAEATFAQGLPFRLAPAREQEQVVAAGFPGVGVRPSFQVSKGTVSNARFGADAGDGPEMGAYVQHTAPIDPGNSGGPLLDGDGNLLGMNTLKIVGRENVGLAIPTSRIQLALLRAEQPARFDVMQAEASCNAAVGALASPRPAGESMSRFGLALYETAAARAGGTDAAAWRERVAMRAGDPIDAARLRAYAGLRAAVEEEGGVRPYEACFEARAAGAPGTFTAKFRTREKVHAITLAEEHGVLRVTKVD